MLRAGQIPSKFLHLGAPNAVVDPLTCGRTGRNTAHMGMVPLGGGPHCSFLSGRGLELAYRATLSHCRVSLGLSSSGQFLARTLPATRSASAAQWSIRSPARLLRPLALRRLLAARSFEHKSSWQWRRRCASPFGRLLLDAILNGLAVYGVRAGVAWQRDGDRDKGRENKLLDHCLPPATLSRRLRCWCGLVMILGLSKTRTVERNRHNARSNLEGKQH
jgi:hypothetical protein